MIVVGCPLGSDEDWAVDYEPSDRDLALMYQDYVVGQATSATLDDCLDPRSDYNALWSELSRKFRYAEDVDPLWFAFAAFLSGRHRRLARRVPWPDTGITEFVLWMLLIVVADRVYQLSGWVAWNTGDLTHVPSAPIRHTRAVLTAAPPVRVTDPTGTPG